MADYDLGTAHGRIVIDSDNKGADSAVRSINSLRAAAAALSRVFQNTRAALHDFAQNLRTAGSSATDSDSKLRRLSTTMTSLAGISVDVAAKIRQFASGLSELSQQALNASNHIASFHDNVLRLGSVRGILGAVFRSFSDMDQQIRNLPRFSRRIVETATAINGIGTSSMLLRKVATRIGLVAAAGAAFGPMLSRVKALGAGLRVTAGALAIISPRIMRMHNAVTQASKAVGNFGRNMGDLGQGILKTVKGMSGMIVGGIMMKNALSGIGRAAKITTMGLGAMSLAAAGVQVIGTVALGALDALKQLSGIALILPGALMAMGIAGGVAVAAFKSVKEAFKASALEGQAFEDAIKDMSPVMKDTARAAQGFYKDFKSLKDIAADSTFKGLGNDIRQLGATYMPMLKSGVAGVGNGLNKIKNGFRDFLAQPATVADLNQAFSMTSRMLGNMSKAVWPFMAALRDIGMVGMEVMTELTGGIGDAASKFGNFIAEARKTGQLKAFITDAIDGFKDLGATVKNIGSGFKTIFEAFGADGGNALERMRASTEKFAEAMDKSSRGGGLETIAESLQRMAGVSIDALSEGLKQIISVMKELAPFAEAMSTAFGSGLATVFQIVGAAARVLASALSSISGAGSVVGTILAIAVGLKAMQVVLSPVTRGIMLMAGAFTTLNGAAKTVSGVSASMGAAARSGTLMSTAMGKIKGAAAAALGGVSLLGAAVAVVGVAIVGAMSSANKMNAGLEAMDAMADAAAGSIKGFTAAFTEANGAMGKGVISEGVNQFKELKTNLDEVASKTPGITDKFFNMRASIGKEGIKFFNTGALHSLEDAGNLAQDAKDAFKELGWSAEEVGAAVTGDQAAWDGLHDSLVKLGGDGVTAVDSLMPMRQAFLDAQAAMGRMGTDSVQLSNALKTIGDGASSAADKLNALKSALQALGLMESTAQEAAFNYQQAIRDMGESATTAADATKPLGDALIGMDGKLNPVQQNAANLRNELITLRDAFQDSAVKGGNVHQMWADMQPALQNLATSFQIPLPKIQELVSQMGVVPDKIETILKVSGQDSVIADLTAVTLEAQKFAGQPITVKVSSEAAVTTLRELGVEVSKYDAKTGEATVTMNADQVTQTMAMIDTLLKNPPKPGEIEAPKIPAPVPPPPAKPIDAPKVEPPKTPAPTPPPPAPPLPAPIIAPPKIPAPLPPPPPAPLPAPPVAVPVTPMPTPPPPAPPIPAPPVEVPQVPQIPPMVVEADASPAIGALESLNGAIQGSIEAWNGFVGGVQSAMGSAAAAVEGMASSAVAALQGAASGAYASGSALGAGFASGIQSQVGAVAAAAAALAAAASAPLPNSPAKIGPFSGKGWTPHRGAALAEGFAEGIRSGTPDALLASLGLAEAVAGAVENIRNEMKLNESVSANGAYIRKGGTSDAELKRQNDDRIAERKKSEARAAKKEAQQEAKKAAKDAAEPKDDKPKSEKQLAKDAKKDEEQLAADRLKEAIQVIEDGNASQEEIARSIGELEKNGLANSPELKEALAVGGRQDSNDADVLKALESIDRSIASTDDIETQDQLESMKSAIMSRKGIEENDPFANASKDVPKDVVSVFQNIFGILDQIEQTMGSLTDLGNLMVRGISNTKDIERGIDSVQGVVSGLAGIADTVGSVISTVSNIAAAAGSVIPGVGQITAGISAVTGGIGSINAVVDLIQQGFKIAGRIGGGFLSALAGGANGPLMGNVKALLDTNDRTIKRWSEDNPDDKRSSSYDLFGRGGNTTNQTGVENLNIIQGPGVDPYRMVDEAMFSVRAAQMGAYNA